MDNPCCSCKLTRGRSQVLDKVESYTALRTVGKVASLPNRLGHPAQHGLSSNTTALTTSDCFKNVSPEHQTALITSDCGTTRSLSIKRP